MRVEPLWRNPSRPDDIRHASYSPQDIRKVLPLSDLDNKIHDRQGLILRGRIRSNDIGVGSRNCRGYSRQDAAGILGFDGQVGLK